MSQRTEQIEALLQQTIGEIITRSIEPPEGTLITITRASVSPDLKQATIYLDIIPDGKRGTSLEIMRKQRGLIQKELAKKMKIRTIPHLNFQIDEKEVYSSEIDRILDELKNE